MRRPRASRVVGRLLKTPPNESAFHRNALQIIAPLSRAFASIAKAITNHNLKNPILKNLNEKISDRITGSVAYTQHCLGSRRAPGGKSKPFTRGHGRDRARDRPK